MKKYTIILLAAAFIFRAEAQDAFTIDEAIQYAVEHNLGLQAKKLEVDQSNADIAGFKSIAMPQINGGVDYQYYFAVPSQPIVDFITPSVYEVLFDENVIDRRDLGPPAVNKFSFFQPHNLTGKLEASMLVFDGSYRYGLKAARMYRDLTRKEINASQYEIKSQVLKAYLNCLITGENIGILDDNIRVIAKSLNDTKAMFEAGFVESLDVDRLQLSFDNLNTQRANLAELKRLSENLLKFQMGYPLDQDIILTEDLAGLVDKMKAEGMQGYEVDYSKRPEYDVIQTGADLNELDYLRQRAGYLPSVRAFANAQASLQRANLFDNNETGLIPASLAGFSINIPIYDGGEKRAGIQKTKIKAEQIALQKKEFEQAVELQASNAYIAFVNASNTLDNREKALDINQRIYDKVTIKFNEGVGSSIEVSQAEASLYEAQAQYISALYDLVASKADLDIALGNL